MRPWEGPSSYPRCTATCCGHIHHFSSTLFAKKKREKKENTRISSRSFVFGVRPLNLIVTDTEGIGVYYAFVGRLSRKASE